MNLINLTTEIWNNSEKIEVQATKEWNENFFLKEWFEKFDDRSKYAPNLPGGNGLPILCKP